MIVIICGGRGYTNEAHAFKKLDKIHKKRPITFVIEGGARGGDKIGHDWAYARGIPTATFHANWDFHKRGAGPIRNGHMLVFGCPDAVITLPGGPGTANMKAQAENMKIEIIEIKDEHH